MKGVGVLRMFKPASQKGIIRGAPRGRGSQKVGREFSSSLSSLRRQKRSQDESGDFVFVFFAFDFCRF